jgi:hypothetical protein
MSTWCGPCTAAVGSSVRLPAESIAVRYLAVVLITITGALMLAFPAMAEPTDSGESAQSVIDGLKAEGYNVVINWLTGYDTVPLWACTVQEVNNPNASPPPLGTFTTVYVDVSCPNHQDE